MRSAHSLSDMAVCSSWHWCGDPERAQPLHHPRLYRSSLPSLLAGLRQIHRLPSLSFFASCFGQLDHPISFSTSLSCLAHTQLIDHAVLVDFRRFCSSSTRDLTAHMRMESALTLRTLARRWRFRAAVRIRASVPCSMPLGLSHMKMSLMLALICLMLEQSRLLLCTMAL